VARGTGDRPDGFDEVSVPGHGAASVEGTVMETLPHGLFRVVIARQRQVTAHVPGGPGRNFIRVLVGDRVRLELSARDLTRGRIVEKLG
jgi:translation initiation factor IF-1